MSLFNPLPNDGDNTFAFPSQCFMLKFNGAWPLAHPSSSRNVVDHLYLCWAYALIILIALTCCAQALYLFSSWGDILIVTECGCTVFMGIHNLLRLMHLSYKRRTLKKLIADFVKQIWISPWVWLPFWTIILVRRLAGNNFGNLVLCSNCYYVILFGRSTHQQISTQCTSQMFVLRYISLLQFVLIWMYILLPLLDLYNLAEGEEKPFPYRMLFPYGTDSVLSYSMTYFLTSLAGFGVVTNLFSEDSLFAFFTTHTCGRFRLLHERISNLMRNSQERALEKYPNLMNDSWSHIRNAAIQREYRDHLIRIINDHRILLRYVIELS